MPSYEGHLWRIQRSIQTGSTYSTANKLIPAVKRKIRFTWHTQSEICYQLVSVTALLTEIRPVQMYYSPARRNLHGAGFGSAEASRQGTDILPLQAATLPAWGHGNMEFDERLMPQPKILFRLGYWVRNYGSWNKALRGSSMCGGLSVTWQMHEYVLW